MRSGGCYTPLFQRVMSAGCLASDQSLGRFSFSLDVRSDSIDRVPSCGSGIVADNEINFLIGFFDCAVFSPADISALQVIPNGPVHLKPNAFMLKVTLQRVMMLCVPRISDFTERAFVLNDSEDLRGHKLIPSSPCGTQRKQILIVQNAPILKLL